MDNKINVKGLRILITGASGFLGSAIFEHLCREGYEVRGLVRQSSSLWRVPHEFHTLISHASPEKWDDYIERFQPEIVVCLSWGGVVSRDRSDIVIQKTSAQSVYQLGRLCHRMGVRKFICIGSQAESQPSDRDIPEMPIGTGTTPYSISKSALLDRFSELFTDKKDFVWARVFSVYGPKDHSDTYVSQLIKSKILNEPFHTEKREMYWSFLYVDDFCSAMEVIINSPELHGVVNLGNPQVHTLGEVSDKVMGVTNNSYNGRRSAYYPEIRKLEGAGWAPKVSLSEGLERTEEWLRSQL